MVQTQTFSAYIDSRPSNANPDNLAATAAGVTVRTPFQRISGEVGPSLANFGILPNGGISDQSALIQSAVDSVYDAGERALFIPPGTYGLDRQNTVKIHENMTIYGVNSQSTFKGIGTIGARPAFPYVGGMMFGLAQRSNGQRYGVETGRLPSGTGATFNVTVSGGAVTSATVVAGGTGYKAGDYINLANGTRLVIATVVSQRGPVATVTVGVPGSGWGVPANPVPQVSSQGRAFSDRILDPATFAENVTFMNLVFDGDYGFDQAMLTGTQFYAGLEVRGALDLLIQGCRGYRFPNTAFWGVDTKRGRVFDNFAKDCGWRGVFGTTRNAFSNTGIYVTTNATELNTDEWLFERNIAHDVGDVGAQFAFIGGGQIRENSFLGCGTIAIEGEASGYAVLDTFALNGGIVIPADAVVSENYIDGTMLDGHLATTTTTAPGSYTSTIALDAISWGSGNQGNLEFRGNTIKNIQRRVIHAIQNNNASVVIEDNNGVNLNNGPAPKLQVVTAVAEQTRVSNNRFRECGGANVIYIENRGLDLVCDNNEIFGVGPSANPVIGVTFFRTTTGQFISMEGNKLTSFYGPGIKIESAVSSANTMRWRTVSLDDNLFVDGNRDGNILHQPYVLVTSRNGAFLNIDLLTIDGISITEGTVRTGALDPLIVVDCENTIASNLVSISGARAPQFATLYSVTPTIAPLATAYVNNA